MNLKGSQTEKNLLLAYTGESLNRNLYTYFAQRALEEGYEQIADIFAETARHEQEHARQELLWIGTSAVDLPAGVYPVKGVGSTLANLEAAASGEHYECTTMYPEFAKVAFEEEFPEIGQLFLNIATVEGVHEKRYLTLLSKLRTGRVFREECAVQWKCRVCGYVNEALESPGLCPVCKCGRAFFERFAENY